MAPLIPSIQTCLDQPQATTVVIIGAGIIGLTAALVLAERGIPVVVLDRRRAVLAQPGLDSQDESLGAGRAAGPGQRSVVG